MRASTCARLSPVDRPFWVASERAKRMCRANNIGNTIYTRKLDLFEPFAADDAEYMRSDSGRERKPNIISTVSGRKCRFSVLASESAPASPSAVAPKSSTKLIRFNQPPRRS